MKFLKIAVAAAFAMAFGQAQALHSGGVAHCDACHTMHNSYDGAPMNVTGSTVVGEGNAFLLQGATVSDTCFNCHADVTPRSYHVYDSNYTGTGAMTANLNFSPGGDFTWVRQSQRKGHNVESSLTGIVADSRKAPPGDTSGWDGTGFSCASCHDPHGQSRYTGTDTLDRPNGTTALQPIKGSGSYGDGTRFIAGDAAAPTAGAYRLLGGNGWKAVSSPGMPAFAVSPPIALAPGNYNRSELTFTKAGSAGQTIVAYVSGMSQWCGTCHAAMHGQASNGSFGDALKHPAGPGATLGATLAANYNKYVKTGDFSGASDAYDSFVPVELGGTRADAVNVVAETTVDRNIAVSATSNVMCLTCHRAHASGFESMMRWNYGTELMIPAAGYGTNTDLAAGFYNRPATAYSTYQRSLCNKCHVKD